MEVIPDIKNSIGYINVNQALSDVFGISVSLVKYKGIEWFWYDFEVPNMVLYIGNWRYSN